MLQFSKNLLFLFLIVALVFGGDERRSAEALHCHKCTNGPTPPDDACDSSHTGESVRCRGACGVEQLEGGKVRKYCETKTRVWKDANGDPICHKPKICFCININDCNKPKSFGGAGDNPNSNPGGVVVPGILRNGAGGRPNNINVFSAISSFIWIIYTWFLYR